jgi:hypothetical protein
MNVIREGHRYLLDNFESNTNESQKQLIQFIEKVPVEEGSTELKTLFDGTTNEEVLAVLINRIQYLQGKFPCKENACCITHLEEALMWLEKRTKDRIKRSVEGKQIK